MMRFIMLMVPRGDDEAEPGTLDYRAASAVLSYAETLRKAGDTRYPPRINQASGDRRVVAVSRTPGSEPYIDPRYAWAVTG
jgi:hypothetical protein